MAMHFGGVALSRLKRLHTAIFSYAGVSDRYAPNSNGRSVKDGEIMKTPRESIVI